MKNDRMCRGFERPDRTMLVLGGARSGKSRHAQRLAESGGGKPIFIATAQAFDTEMTDRIARHRADRDARWRTIEAPLALPDAIREADADGAMLLVDCLTLWASNLLLADADAEEATASLCTALATPRGRIILVANEVGLGIVPDNALARRFRDIAGTMNQRVAAIVDRVDMVAAGLPFALK